MSKQYKITESPSGVFKIYRRNWFGCWRPYGTDYVWGWEDSVYESRGDAEDRLTYHINKDSQKKNFHPRHWYFYGD